jgi:hypothetical protein
MDESLGIIHVLGSIIRLCAPSITPVKVELPSRFTSRVLAESATILPVRVEFSMLKVAVDPMLLIRFPLPAWMVLLTLLTVIVALTVS